ncbi:hypothetical protein RHGRI_023015 [Rhododendron griersonianum]|uniref:Uncharacterized protein n=1 Tax=Rhododendron griersonianum TaxID=479676 RepID=A0AAV6J1M9_9ERIC|nr:hypothetical protein RHGRI_023015 [Rhododendron griersonianum]
MQTFGNEGDSAVPSEVFYFVFLSPPDFLNFHFLENAGFSRVLLNDDYTNPVANTNESGYYISPSDQTPDVP